MTLLTEVNHGTGFPITKETVVDMKDTIYRLDTGQNPFLVFLNMFPKVTCFDTQYSWLEREGFERRTFVAEWIITTNSSHADEDMLAIEMNGRDWNAIAFIAQEYETSGYEGSVRINVTNQDGATASADVVNFVGYLTRLAYTRGHTTRKLANASADESTNYYSNTIQLSWDAATEAKIEVAGSQSGEVIVDPDDYDGSGGGNFVWDLSKITTATPCFVTVEFPNMQAKGHKQGSGLGKETKKISNWKYNYTQIFKDPVSATRTMQGKRYIGGDKRLQRQLEVGASHASDIEYALMFQGGGTEGVGGDWGIMDATENPKTIMKGLGIGHASGKEGLIVSNNGNPAHAGATAGKPCQVTTITVADYVNLMERVYDDQKAGSQSKIMFASMPLLKDLSLLAMNPSGPFELEPVPTYAREIGVAVSRFRSIFGTLDVVLHPGLSGPYRRYGVILDMKNINLRPYSNGDTKLHLDVASKEIDGNVDEYRSELGLELRHEHTHAIVYLDGTIT